MPFFNIKGKTVLFVHIPKAGGSTIENWLNTHSDMYLFSSTRPDGFLCPPQHFHCDLLQEIGFGGPHDYTFTVVRDPLDRIISEFFWLHRKKPNLLRKWEAASVGIWGTSAISRYFHRWIRSQFATAKRAPFHRGNHMRPQVQFLGLQNEKVFKFEDGVEAIMTTLARDLGLEPPEKKLHANKSPRTDLPILAKTRRAIDDFYGSDFEALGYALASTRD